MKDLLRRELAKCAIALKGDRPGRDDFEPLVAIWLEQVEAENFSEEVIAKAFTRYRGESEFFPAPAGVLTLARAIRAEAPEYTDEELDRLNGLR